MFEGPVLEERHIDGFVQRKYYAPFYELYYWTCTCSQYAVPKPCTPNFCRHTDQINEEESNVKESH